MIIKRRSTIRCTHTGTKVNVVVVAVAVVAVAAVAVVAVDDNNHNNGGRRNPQLFLQQHLQNLILTV